MAWKIVGYIEGRNGHVTFLPSVGEPNSFDHVAHASAGAAGMQAALGGEKSPIRYLAVPALDPEMHKRITGGSQQVAPPAPPPPPLVSFTAPTGTPQPAQAFPGNGAHQQ